MPDEVVEKLLAALSVKLGNFSVCEIGSETRLLLEPKPYTIIHYVLRGQGTVRVESGIEAAFSECSLIVVPAGCLQSIGASHTRRTEKFRQERCITLSDGLHHYRAGSGDGVKFACGSLRATYAGCADLFQGLKSPLVLRTQSADPLRHFYEMFLSEMSNPIVGARAATEALMKLCLVTIVRQQTAQLGSSPFLIGLRDRKLAGAIAEMVERPGDPHSVESLALAAGMCRSLFADQFRAVFGTSPIDFLQGIRLAMAHDLLATTDLPIKRITQVIGLRSRSNFSRAFRERYQIDPTGFRAASKDMGHAGMSL